MKSGFAKIQTYNKHTHRHERNWNEMKACRRNNNLDIRYAVRAVPMFLCCTRVYWYSRSNSKLCSLICSVGTYVYIYLLVHAYIHMNTHPYIHKYAYTQVTYRDMYTYYMWCGSSGTITLMMGQNGGHFADNIFKCIFLNMCLLIQISVKFVSNGSINNSAALVQQHAITWNNDDQI